MRPFLALVSLVLIAVPALAQPNPPTPGPETPAPVIMEFDPEGVNGTTQSPDHVVTQAHVRELLPSLVRVRTDFRAELLQSAEML